jgi:glyoxylase-like metal-dependent hydrolase (beta-lactamase superfamily II)
MYFKQFYLGCLAHASYLIGSGGEAAVIDPQRDVDQYINEARAAGLNIRYVIETHLHADFVSGHRELAARTGAEIVFGQKAGATFPHREVKDGDQIQLGTVRLRFLETPGHTPESISIVVTDMESPDAPQKVLTGDTLFIGDVGRPDLVGAKGYSAEQMAGMLFDSLHKKLLQLDDRTEVYPAHGAGSMCGRNISKETSSTIGEQKRFNYALKPMGKDEFVRMMTTDMPEAPRYFPLDAEINRTGASTLRDLPRPAALTAAEVERLVREEHHLVLDVRPGAAFGAGHIAGSLNIALGGQFASWAGTLIQIGTLLILVADELAQIDEAQMRLARVGIETVKGYVDGGIHAWNKAGLALSTVAQMPVDELSSRVNERADLQIVDVRTPGEYQAGHAPGAVNFPLSKLEAMADQLDRRPTAVICQSGYRSSAACSLLARKGFKDLFNVVGGTAAWINAGYATETAAKPNPQ